MLEPTRSDLGYIEATILCRSGPLAFDIETKHGCILCISLCRDPKFTVTIPFVDRTKPQFAYWPNANDEAAALAMVYRLLRDPTIPKVAQNGLYDIQWIADKWGFPVYGFSEDTMLLHHALFPELPKNLGFMGSVYTNERAWKFYGGKGIGTEKREDE